MDKCKCDDGILNSGIQACSSGFGRVKKLIFVPYYDSTGAKNSISNTDVLDKAFYEAKVNESDASEKWYPTDEIFNIVDERGDDVVETIEGVDFNIESGKRVFTGEFVNDYSKSPAYTAFLKSLTCPLVGVYYVDEYGDIIGQSNGDNLDPFLIQRGSVKVKYIPKSFGSVGRNQITYTLGSSNTDADIKFRVSEDDAELLDLNGLVSVELSSFVSTTTTAVNGVALLGNSTNQSGIAFGAEAANFEAYNVTLAAPITIVSATANAVTGGIDFVLTAGDVNTTDSITIKTNLSGFESNVIALTLI